MHTNKVVYFNNPDEENALTHCMNSIRSLISPNLLLAKNTRAVPVFPS